MCADLLEEHADLFIYDPKVPAAQVYRDLGIDETHERVTICADAYEATKDAHAILILTEWDAFKALDFQRIYEQMQLPAFLFDGRNLLDLEALRKIGFEASGIGRG